LNADDILFLFSYMRLFTPSRVNDDDDDVGLSNFGVLKKTMTTNRFALLADTDVNDDDDDDDDDNDAHRKTNSGFSAAAAATSTSTRASSSSNSSDYYKDQTYYLIMGNEDVVTESGHSSSIAATAAAPDVVPSLNNSVSFFGKCFSCHYMSHSQKYCPLRLCKTCVTYGHAESVCHRARA